MTKREREYLRSVEEDLGRQVKEYRALRSFLIQVHPEVLKEYQDLILAKTILGDGVQIVGPKRRYF